MTRKPKGSHVSGGQSCLPALLVSRGAARRYLVQRTGLGRPVGEARRWADPAAASAAIQALEYLQVDPMRVLETNHQLTLGARVGGYSTAVLSSLLYQERSVVEVVARNRYIVPVEDYWLFRLRFAEMEERNGPQVASLEPMMARVMARITAEGPLSSLDFEEDERISGWWQPDDQLGTRAVRQVLEWLWHFGRLAVSHRTGARRYFDLPERLLGDWAAAAPLEPEQRIKMRDGLLRKYIRSAGLVDPRDWGFGWTKYTAAEKRAIVAQLVGAGELLRVEIEGVTTGYYIPTVERDALVAAEGQELAPDLSILPPLDNLIWLRSRTAELFGFDYTWEAYTPPAKRRYGPYTCPILRGDALIGRIDAVMDRRNAALVVNGVWWEPECTPVEPGELRSALHRLAQICGGSEVQAGPALAMPI